MYTVEPTTMTATETMKSTLISSMRTMGGTSKPMKPTTSNIPRSSSPGKPVTQSSGNWKVNYS